jgi:hypothetical protein
MTRKITTRTIRRLRSAPRIVSLAGDVGDSSPMKKLASPLPKKPEDVPQARPSIINSVFMRPEARTDLPSSLFTSVLTLPENETSPRVIPPRLAHEKLITHAKLQVHSTSRTTTTLDIKPRCVRDSHALEIMTKEMCEGGGLKIRPGQTIVSRLNQHRNFKGRMRCVVEGDQAVRLTLFNEGGGLISDVDLPPHAMPFSMDIGRTASFLSLTGLGGHPEVLKAIEPGAGAVTLTCTTDNTVATGFHPRNRVIQTTGGFQLCRGGVIHANGVLDTGNGWIPAENVLRTANRVSLQTSSRIDLALVIYRNSEVPKISAEGIDVVGEPHTIRDQNLSASIWPVRSNSHNGSLCTISAQMKEVGSIHSIIAAKGSVESWIRTLENCDWSTIVEEGAISNHGQAKIRLNVLKTAETDGGGQR